MSKRDRVTLLLLALVGILVVGAIIGKYSQDAPAPSAQVAPPTSIAPTPPVSNPYTPSAREYTQAPVAPPQPPPAYAREAQMSMPPQEVLEYLGFVRRMDVSRKELTRNQTEELNRMQARVPDDQARDRLNFSPEPNSPSPEAISASQQRVDQMHMAAQRFANQWTQLANVFTNHAPPPICQDLHDRYYSYLGKVQAGTINVVSVLAQVEHDPQAALQEAEAMKNDGTEIDAELEAADQALGNVFDRFKLPHDFSLKN